MESISLTKRLLVAGGLLVCGYIAYSYLKKREEEVRQQEITEEADYEIIVEKDTIDSEKLVKDISIIKPENIFNKNISSLSVVKDNSIEIPDNSETKNVVVSTNHSTTIKSEIDIVQESIDESINIDSQIAKDINLLTVIDSKEFENKVEAANDDFPLQLGSKGKRVWNVKAYMLRNHGASGIVTDQYTTQTVERVKRYLKADNVTEQLYMRLNMDSSQKKRKNATAKKKKH